MTESGAARPGDSQGRNLLHETPRGDPVQLRQQSGGRRDREPKVCRLSAGGRWIRTICPAARRDWPFREHLDRPPVPSPPREATYPSEGPDRSSCDLGTPQGCGEDRRLAAKFLVKKNSCSDAATASIYMRCINQKNDSV